VIAPSLLITDLVASASHRGMAAQPSRETIDIDVVNCGCIDGNLLCINDNVE
jgi:hypothetical protein